MAATDPVLLIKTLLSVDWAPANTDSTTPTFKEPDDREELKRGDLLLVYSGRPLTMRRLDNRVDFRLYEASVTVDMKTSGVGAVKPKAHGVKMREEVERILNNKKNDPDAYWNFIEIDEGGSTEAEYSNFFRQMMNILVRRWGIVPT